LNAIKEAYNQFPGVQVLDDWEKNYFPMPIEVSGKDDVYVGRIRYDYEDQEKKTVSLFAVGDQLLKGAALNAVQIAELL
jgi:aspartate-semialdehyde dehydrogenase